MQMGNSLWNVFEKKHTGKQYKVNIYRLFASLHDKTVKYTKYVLCILM